MIRDTYLLFHLRRMLPSAFYAFKATRTQLYRTDTEMTQFWHRDATERKAYYLISKLFNGKCITWAHTPIVRVGSAVYAERRGY